jgi:hypothetical protein
VVRSDFFGRCAISLYLNSSRRTGVERLYISSIEVTLPPLHDIGMVVFAYY